MTLLFLDFFFSFLDVLDLLPKMEVLLVGFVLEEEATDASDVVERRVTGRSKGENVGGGM